jgi:hypothetical protein
MSGWTAALITYILLVIIAFFCAGMIHLIVVLLGKRSPKE